MDLCLQEFGVTVSGWLGPGQTLLGGPSSPPRGVVCSLGQARAECSPDPAQLDRDGFSGSHHTAGAPARPPLAQGHPTQLPQDPPEKAVGRSIIRRMALPDHLGSTKPEEPATEGQVGMRVLLARPSLFGQSPCPTCPSSPSRDLYSA